MAVLIHALVSELFCPLSYAQWFLVYFRRLSRDIMWSPIAQTQGTDLSCTPFL